MKRRERILTLVAVLLLIGAFKLGQQVYRWHAYAGERSEIARLEGELEEAAIGVIRTQLRADTLRREIEDADHDLGASRGELERAERRFVTQPVSRSAESAYRRNLADHNQRVARRNELFRDWRDTVDRNHLFVDRYNLLVDSIRGLAERMGEPYYPIRSPAEIAAGVDPRGEGG